MQDFTDKVAVITGGASGIGLGLARRFVAEGMKVVVGDVEKAPLDDAVAELEDAGADVLGMVMDVTDPAQMQELADAAMARHGAVHVFCNNAGVGTGGLSWELPIEEWQWCLGVNLFGVIHGMRTFVPLLMQQEDAHIVNTASVAGLVAAPMMGPYNASKHAVVAISQTLFHEMAMAGGKVNVHVLCPGWVNTRIAEAGRNRPAHLGGVPSEAESQMSDMLKAVLAAGMETGEVADYVVRAMREGRFWVLTHEGDEWSAAIENVHRSIRERSNPQMTMFV